jgi:Luciferase-like monooxygenase
MQVGFFFWPYTPELCERLAERADRYGYAMIGIADTPGNAMDPWVSAAIVARGCRRARVALCVTNLLTRHPAVSAFLSRRKTTGIFLFRSPADLSRRPQFRCFDQHGFDSCSCRY